MMDVLLWLVAVALGIAGIVRLAQRDFVAGILLLCLAFVIGPGGVSVF